MHLRVADLEASRRFYRAALQAVGQEFSSESPDHFAAGELWVDRADGPVSQVLLAFQATDRVTVDAFHKAAEVADGRDNGKPGERRYHPRYCSTFVLDTDGNDIAAVHHGRAERSAASVVVTPKG